MPHTVDECRADPHRMLENAIEQGICRIKFEDGNEARHFYKQLRALAYYGRGKGLGVIVRHDGTIVSAIKDTKYLPSAEFI